MASVEISTVAPPVPLQDTLTLDTLQHIQVRFISELESKVPPADYSVPIQLKRDGLNELVNHLLSQESSVSYEFLVDGQFLRGSLKRYLERTKISAETVLTIEYIESKPDLQINNSIDQPDWISSIDTIGECLVTACYDNVARVWTHTNESPSLVCEARGHSAPIKAVRAISNEEFVTVSKDQSIRVWDSSTGAQRGVVEVAHSDSIDCVAVCPDTSSSLMSTGSFDGVVKLWKIDSKTNIKINDKQTHKRARISHKQQQREITSLATCTPTHTQATTALCWPHPLALYSASWDSSIRHYDVDGGALVRQWVSPAPCSALDFSSSSNMIVAGHTDFAVRLYDPRVTDGAIVASCLRGHHASVVDVTSAPTHNTLYSVSLDGVLCVWDTRCTTAPLQSVCYSKQKQPLLAVHCVLPHNHNEVVCGGADAKLHFLKPKHQLKK